MSTLIQQGKELIQSLNKTYEWYKTNKPNDTRTIADKESNVRVALRLFKSVNVLAELDTTKEYVIVEAIHAHGFPEGITCHELKLKDEKLIEQLKRVKQDSRVVVINSDDISFKFGSSYYDGCEQYNIEWNE